VVVIPRAANSGDVRGRQGIRPRSSKPKRESKQEQQMNTKALPKTFTAFILAGAVAASTLPFGATSSAAQDMPASTRLAMPGAMHEWMKPLVGEWNVEMLVYPGPGAEPIISTDLTATRELILGGRYLQEELTGQFAGNPSHRIATLGYNGLDERFELVTVDTFEPGVMMYHSAPGSSAGLISLSGESTEAGMGPEPTGRKRDLRFDWEITQTGSVQRIFVKYPGQPEFLFVEQRFTPKS
jgi:hypothetical protein